MHKPVKDSSFKNVASSANTERRPRRENSSIVSKKHNKNNGNDQHDHLNKASSSSLIEILQSFGICVRTKINFHGGSSSSNTIGGDGGNIQRQFSENYMNKMNSDLIVEGFEEEFEQEVQEGKIKLLPHENVINIGKAKMIIRFKCEFDHTKPFKNLNSDTFSRLDQLYKQATFNSVVNGTERKDANVLNIEIDFKFKNISEVVKYLNLSGSSTTKLIENEILSKLVEILDVDSEKKQVYIKLKTLIGNRSSNLYCYYLMGKIDGSDSCFMLDMTHVYRFHRTITTINNIYKHFTPKLVKSRIYNKGNKTNLSTFHDCKDVGIYRALIGCFFICMTDKTLGYHSKHSHYHPYDIINTYQRPVLLGMPNKDNSGYGMMAEKSTSYGACCSGIIETGFYNFELKSLCTFVPPRPPSSHLVFKKEFYHFVF